VRRRDAARDRASLRGSLQVEGEIDEAGGWCDLPEVDLEGTQAVERESAGGTAEASDCGLVRQVPRQA
jgi:hypothetical protein